MDSLPVAVELPAMTDTNTPPITPTPQPRSGPSANVTVQTQPQLTDTAWGLGPWGFIAKTGIIGAMIVMLMFVLRFTLSQSSEREAADRQMYREDMKEQRTLANDAINKLSVTMESNTKEVVGAIGKLDISVTGLRGDIHRTVSSTFSKVDPKIAPPPHSKNPDEGE